MNKQIKSYKIMLLFIFGMIMLALPYFINKGISSKENDLINIAYIIGIAVLFKVMFMFKKLYIENYELNFDVDFQNEELNEKLEEVEEVIESILSLSVFEDDTIDLIYSTQDNYIKEIHKNYIEEGESINSLNIAINEFNKLLNKLKDINNTLINNQRVYINNNNIFLKENFNYVKKTEKKYLILNA